MKPKINFDKLAEFSEERAAKFGDEDIPSTGGFYDTCRQTITARDQAVQDNDQKETNRLQAFIDGWHENTKNKLKSEGYKI